MASDYARKSSDAEIQRLRRLYASTKDYDILQRLRFYTFQRGVCLHEYTRCFYRRQKTGPSTKICPECGGSGQSTAHDPYNLDDYEIINCITCGGDGAIPTYYTALWIMSCRECGEHLQEELVTARAGYEPDQPDWCLKKFPVVQCAKCSRTLTQPFMGGTSTIPKNKYRVETYCGNCGYWNAKFPGQGLCTAVWGCLNPAIFACDCGEAFCDEHGNADESHVCY